MKQTWPEREAYVLEQLLYAKRSPFSGGQWMQKEDAYSEHFLYQMKSTNRESIPVRLDDIVTLGIHAKQQRKLPIFVLDFLQGPLFVCFDRKMLSAYVQGLEKEGIIKWDRLENDDMKR